MTNTIDIGGGIDATGLELNLAETGETESEYIQSMGTGAPGFFEVVLGGLYAPIATGFESAAFSAADAYAEVGRISVGQVQIAGVIAHRPPSATILDPQVQLHLVIRYLGRQHAYEAANRQLMHHAMERQIRVLGYALNQTRAAITHISGNIIRYVNRQTAAEARIRSANDGSIIKLAFALRDRVSADLKTWAVREIAYPLAQEIGRVDAHRAAVTTQQIQQSQLATLERVGAIVAPVAAAAFTAQKIATKLQTVNAECVQPMCETMGPNTPLGNALNKIKGIKWLAILAALEVIDIKTLEQLALKVYGFEGEVGSYVATKILDVLEAEHGPAS